MEFSQNCNLNDVFLIKDDFDVNNERIIKTVENKKIENKNSNYHLTLPPIISNKNNHHKIVVLKRKKNNSFNENEEKSLILTGIDYVKEKNENSNENEKNSNENEKNSNEKNENEKNEKNSNENEKNENKKNSNENEKIIKKNNFSNLIDLKELLNDEEKLEIEKIEEKKFKEHFLNDNNNIQKNKIENEKYKLKKIEKNKQKLLNKLLEEKNKKNLELKNNLIHSIELKKRCNCLKEFYFQNNKKNMKFEKKKLKNVKNNLSKIFDFMRKNADQQFNELINSMEINTYF